MPTNPPAPVTKTEQATAHAKRAEAYFVRRWAFVLCAFIMVVYVIAFGWRIGGTMAVGMLIGALAARAWR
jgi:lipopolysaccharide export LptBFGC system permease protein LptF